MTATQRNGNTSNNALGIVVIGVLAVMLIPMPTQVLDPARIVGRREVPTKREQLGFHVNVDDVDIATIV